MLGLRYDSEPARELAAGIAERMRDEAYLASAGLAAEKGGFPLFDADAYLRSGSRGRLPEPVRQAITRNGLRNSHLLSIAPTGTITLAFADNASNGIEPAFSWTYHRKKRMPDNSYRSYEVADHAWRLYRHTGADMDQLPDAFARRRCRCRRSTMRRMLEAVQPYIDTSISETVNVPEDYLYEAFRNLYLEAWKAGLKGLATVPAEQRARCGAVGQHAGRPGCNGGGGGNGGGGRPAGAAVRQPPRGDLEVTSKLDYMTYEGHKTVYLTVNFMRVSGVLDGMPVEIERPIEFFMPAGQRSEGGATDHVDHAPAWSMSRRAPEGR
ncbi:hypothetical protein ACTMU2_08155 [Cupriavidus basilensis]